MAQVRRTVIFLGVGTSASEEPADPGRGGSMFVSTSQTVLLHTRRHVEHPLPWQPWLVESVLYLMVLLKWGYGDVCVCRFHWLLLLSSLLSCTGCRSWQPWLCEENLTLTVMHCCSPPPLQHP
jgi:hypothetical protein